MTEKKTLNARQAYLALAKGKFVKSVDYKDQGHLEMTRKGEIIIKPSGRIANSSLMGRFVIVETPMTDEQLVKKLRAEACEFGCSPYGQGYRNALLHAANLIEKRGVE